jgi:hypothetical protein
MDVECVKTEMLIDGKWFLMGAFCIRNKYGVEPPPLDERSERVTLNDGVVVYYQWKRLNQLLPGERVFLPSMDIVVSFNPQSRAIETGFGTLKGLGTKKDPYYTVKAYKKERSYNIGVLVPNSFVCAVINE